eukprot:m.5208 g.5208  ORF g.5208 m.5208 type:complete len:88 (+) comp3758_c0_seq2:229-492(+)
MVLPMDWYVEVDLHCSQCRTTCPPEKVEYVGGFDRCAASCSLVLRTIVPPLHGESPVARTILGYDPLTCQCGLFCLGSSPGLVPSNP